MSGAPETLELQIGLDASLAFARLAGDFNPLHTDPVYARRTRYGASVVHGIHLVLCALDAALERELRGTCPIAISCTFGHPVRTDSLARIIRTDVSDARVRLVGEADGLTAFSLAITLDRQACAVAAIAEDREFEEAPPRQATLPAVGDQGVSELRLGHGALRRLFPRLARASDTRWIADLLATTRIVGMDCPGLHSIYGAFKLESTPLASSSGSMHYTIQRSDPRFRLVKLAVSGAILEGTVEAFFRAPPVAQRPLAEIRRSAPADAFRGQHALVIGGSRGVGEVAAKLLLAGGAEVTITYASGQADAARVCAEARSEGLTLTALQLDITTGAASAQMARLAAGAFTHVYYFASPHIASNASGRFNFALFERFSNVYVNAFAALCETMAIRHADAAPLRILYPSSVFLDGGKRGFAEYCAAKAAGEWMCEELSRQQHVAVACPRLPRMRTDQTSELPEKDIPDPFNVIAALLPAFHAGDTTDFESDLRWRASR